jgi:hypothetical protein
MIDMNIQTDFAPSSIPFLMANSEAQTDTVTITPTPARPPTDVHATKFVVVDAGIQTDRMTPILALTLKFPTVNNVSTEDLTLASTKTAMVDIGRPTNLPIESAFDCGPALTTSQVKESKNLAFGTTTCTGIRTDTAAGPILAATVNDQIKNLVFTPDPAAAINDTIQAYITKKSATVCSLPPPVPTNVQGNSIPTSIPEPLPVTVALRQAAEGINVVAVPQDLAAPVVRITWLSKSQSKLLIIALCSWGKSTKENERLILQPRFPYASPAPSCYKVSKMV